MLFDHDAGRAAFPRIPGSLERREEDGLLFSVVAAVGERPEELERLERGFAVEHPRGFGRAGHRLEAGEDGLDHAMFACEDFRRSLGHLSGFHGNLRVVRRSSARGGSAPRGASSVAMAPGPAMAPGGFRGAASLQ